MSEFDDMPTIEPGLYQHYKGDKYRVVGVGCHSGGRCGFAVLFAIVLVDFVLPWYHRSLNAKK